MDSRELVYFDSRQIIYKKPYGAVPLGKNIVFRLSISRRMSPVNVVLYFRHDSDIDNRIIELEWESRNGSRDSYICSLDADNCGLHHYYFKIDTAVSTAYYGAPNEGEGGAGLLTYNSFIPYSVTFYKSNKEFPDWYGNTITYQIFPDRFYCSPNRSAPEIDGRIIHNNRNDLPRRRTKHNGDILNNDFYGGNIRGIIEKLDYLLSLGVGTIYLNPIFLAASNHRYDTADYMTIDPYLGNDADFKELCEKADNCGIKIMLDGVFNHTGADSIYFNKYAKYGQTGAYQSRDSEFFQWYTFTKYPDDYNCWWGVKILPTVNKDNRDFRNYIYGNENNNVIRKWMDLGVSAWRLDVADELPDDFIAELSSSAKKIKSDCFILGEVWEDASLKTAYGKRKTYFIGNELDGVMNYPFRKALIRYLKGWSAEHFKTESEKLFENYPEPCLFSSMNIIGTHDTPRIINRLGAVKKNIPVDPEQKAIYKLTPKEYSTGKKLLKLAVIIQMLFPGSPVIYYGDETGTEGFEDPFNRRYMDFDNIDTDIFEYYKKIAMIRKKHIIFSRRIPSFIKADDGLLEMRWEDRETAEMIINRSDKKAKFRINNTGNYAEFLISEKTIQLNGGIIEVTLSPKSGEIIMFRNESNDG